MALQAIAYASQAVPDLSDAQLDHLIRRAAERNQMAGVTGLLLFDGSRFLQYIEGPDDGMAMVYARIQLAPTHTDIVELARGRVSQRRMPYWSMRWIPVGDADLKAAMFSDWTTFALRKVGTRPVPTGVDRLAAFAAPYIE